MIAFTAAELTLEQENVLAEQATAQDEVKRYYTRAGENSARIVYFKGMLIGTAALAALVGFAFLLSWGLGWLDPGDEATYTLFSATPR